MQITDLGVTDDRYYICMEYLPGEDLASVIQQCRRAQRTPSVEISAELALGMMLALFSLGNSSNMFLLLRAKELGLSDYQVPLLWALTSGVAMLLSAPLSALSDQIGRARLILAGWAVYGLFYLAMGLNGFHTALLWPLFAFYGLFLAATEGAEKALVADLAPPNRLGTAYGWFNLTAGIMLLPASVLFGAIYQQAGAPVAFAFSAACALAAALLLPLWALRGRHFFLPAK